MATPGFGEPYTKLTELFLGNTTTDHERSVVHRMVDEAILSTGDSLLNRFLQRVSALVPDKVAGADHALVDGLLRCIANGWYTGPLTLKENGIWDHFKGGVYLKTGHGSWASGDGEPVIEYISMIYGTKHYRLASQWCDVVQWPDGGYRSRFVYRGSDLMVQAPSFKVPRSL
jgi:hypothetical protein